jgi:hypothetical protein
VHGSNARNLYVELSLSQTIKNTFSFFLLLMSSLQQNWRRGQNSLCLEEMVVWGEGGDEVQWGDMAQAMCAHRE